MFAYMTYKVIPKMAVSHGFNILRNMSSLRGSAVIPSVLASARRLRRLSSLSPPNQTLLERRYIRQRSISSFPETEEMEPKIDDSVDIHGIENILEHPDFFEVHKLFTLRDLFDAKVHLGHHEGCWCPLMKSYLYGTREHYHIIDLNQTVEHLRLALNVLSHIVYRGGVVLFVSTHPRYEELTQRTARDCGEFFVTRKWRGGTFTNSYMLTGTTRVPDLVVFLHLPSLGRNTQPVKEAAQANIPTIAIVDSDCNPNLIMYPIPGNDDSPPAVELYCELFKKAVLRSKEVRSERRSRRQTTNRDEEISTTSDARVDRNESHV